MKLRRQTLVGQLTYDELAKWREAGLITFKDTESMDEVMAKLLAALRESLCE